jgi:hypothetical protein
MFRLYMTEEQHESVAKAARILEAAYRVAGFVTEADAIGSNATWHEAQSARPR